MGNFVYLCICICVFACQTPQNIVFEVLVPRAFRNRIGIILWMTKNEDTMWPSYSVFRCTSEPVKHFCLFKTGHNISIALAKSGCTVKTADSPPIKPHIVGFGNCKTDTYTFNGTLMQWWTVGNAISAVKTAESAYLPQAPKVRSQKKITGLFGNFSQMGGGGGAFPLPKLFLIDKAFFLVPNLF